MGIPINIRKITEDDKTSFIIQIDENNYKSKTNWQKTYISSTRELIQFKERIDKIYDEFTLAEKLLITNAEGAEIEKFYKTEALCKACDLKETTDCIECVFELQSPLERKLYVELKKNGIWFKTQYGLDYFGKKISTKDKEYDNPDNNFKDVLTIVDFYIHRGDVKLCVYTDGHTYHERTEKQALKDRKIDRKLQELGFKVLRYTGKEVNENVAKIVKDINKWIK